jgi:hypothetical protein
LRRLSKIKASTRGSRRLGIFVVAAAYSLAVTDAAFVVLDELFPVEATRLASAAGFKCASHACGCADEAACKQRCCCFNEDGTERPHGGSAEFAERDAARMLVSAVLAARCAGPSRQGSLAGLAKIPPHALSVTRVDFFVTAGAPFDQLENPGLESRPREPPQKVPIV